MTAFASETFWLGRRSLRRFLRVPSNTASIIIYPLIQLLLFSQLFADIVRLPGFGQATSYLAYLVPGQVAFTVLIATSWAASGLLLGTTGAAMIVGALIGWLLGSTAIGLLVGALVGIPLAIAVVYKVYSSA